MSPAFIHCFCQAESPLSNLNSQSDPKNRAFGAVLKYILLMITESFYSANSIFIFLSIHLYGSIDIRTTGFPVDCSSAFLTFIAHKHSGHSFPGIDQLNVVFVSSGRITAVLITRAWTRSITKLKTLKLQKKKVAQVTVN